MNDYNVSKYLEVIVTSEATAAKVSKMVDLNSEKVANHKIVRSDCSYDGEIACEIDYQNGFDRIF